MNETVEQALLHNYLLVGALLFAIGMVGFVVRRNMIVVFLCAEMMLQGVALSLVGWSRYFNDWGGQMLTLFIITVAACEAAIALALILMLARQTGKLDLADWQDLREEGAPPYVDHLIPEQQESPAVWPHLTPAGQAPEVDEETLLHRDRV